MGATISVICYKSKTLANGEHPLMLRIAQNEESDHLKSIHLETVTGQHQYQVTFYFSNIIPCDCVHDIRDDVHEMRNLLQNQ
ncbi:Arm DNA-binding domain-containing protein [uncultured Phocaeicola sp.]|jgi:hypothetical protein|uniref:Arm DNA-binding domain-containing protein n=1 Tax=uncultured Phocaeicola sp. TaxID=990718 RepID=UPI00345453B5